MPMKLKIVSPDKAVLDRTADSVRLMMESGSVGILPGHLPFAGRIKGPSAILINGGEEEFSVNGGFAVVMPDSVTVFAGGTKQ